MKKMSACALFIAMLLYNVAFAADMVEYYISELDATVNIPSDFFAITPDTPADDPFFDQYGSDGQQVLAENSQDGIVIDALGFEVFTNIVVAVTPNTSGLSSFYALSEQQVEEALEEVETIFNSSSGIVVKDSSARQAGGFLYFVLDFSLQKEAQTFFTRQYVTVYDDHMISILIRNLAGEVLSDTQLAQIQDVASSLHFNQIYTTPTPTEISTRLSTVSSHAQQKYNSARGFTDILSIAFSIILVFYLKKHGIKLKKTAAKPLVSNALSAAMSTPSASTPKIAALKMPPTYPKHFDAITFGLSEQMSPADRDRVIADVFRGDENPYTHHPITCEADWQNYVAAYYARKYAQPAPDAATPSHATRCRFCGAMRLTDSMLCEHCGKQLSIK